MAKIKKPVTPVTEAHIGAAAKSNVVRNLVTLASAFSRAGVQGPFGMALPLFAPMEIEDKSGGGLKFRRGQIPMDAKLNAGVIRIGKRDGLIFTFQPAERIMRQDEVIRSVEMTWDDVVNSFPVIIDSMDRILDQDANAFVKMIDIQVKDAISRNASMHEVFSKGFAQAQQEMRVEAVDGQLEAIEGFGIF